MSKLLKSFLFQVFLIVNLVASAKTYYVAPSGGSDYNPGTISQPWATWQKGFNTAVAGDTVFFRGGVYYRQQTDNELELNPTEGKGHNGTANDPIVFMGYPPDLAKGDTAIYDCIKYNPPGEPFVTAYNNGITIISAEYIVLKNLVVRNIWQGREYVMCRGVSVLDSKNMVLENLSVYNVSGHGIFTSTAMPVEPNTWHLTNIDTYNCIDTFAINPYNYNLGQAGTWGVGIFCTASEYTRVIIDGCRAWNNADDGFNPNPGGQIITKNCWAFDNGVYLDYLSYQTDGNGFKLNQSDEAYDDDRVTHVVFNCIAAFNHGLGFTENSNGSPYMYRWIYNNMAYKNEQGFVIQGNRPEGYIHKDNQYINNVGYLNTYADWGEYQGGFALTEIYNSWNTPPGVTVNSSDFVYTNDNDIRSLLYAPRNADWSLPSIHPFTLSQNSDLIDAGFNIVDSLATLGEEFIFSGLAPDLGPSELISGDPAPSYPVYVRSVIENSTPSRLEMTYNLTLANIIPSASAYTVKVNTVTRAVSSVTISGTKVFLTLASPVAYGDAVTVAYTKPASNPLQTAAGGQAASLTASNVTNNVAAIIPAYVSSVIENSTPSRLEMTYNLTLASIIPAASAFTVKVNTITRAVSSVTISGTKVLLTLASPVVHGDAVTVAYTKPSSNPLQTAAGGQAASLTVSNVVNNVAAAIPVFVSSVIENSTPSRLEMTYNLTLANIIPSTSAYTVKVNTVTRAVSSVTISGTKVLLTLASPVVHGDAVTVAYTKPSSNPLQTTVGGQAGSLTAQSVINNCSPTPNQSPIITITSPSKSLTFISPANINIEASASDPDGIIVKVEYYNGSVKLGERTAAPYSFTWKDVLEGTYILTAIAFDNSGARTVSSAVTVVIEKSAEVINQLPVVTITSPGKSGKYKKHDKIAIVVTASDPDGSISKVELKSGDVIVGETTVAPYSFTLEAVDTGIYILTAIATDNLGATSASSSIELFVELQDNAESFISALFPNPNDGHFSINISSPLPAGENSVCIVNMTGKIIYRGLLSEGQVTKEFEMSDSASGTYILLVSTGNTLLSSRKFIIR